MARSLYNLTDPVLDVILRSSVEKQSLLLKLARLAYLPILVTLGWQWANLSAYFLSKKLGSALYRLTFSEIPAGLPIDMFWVFPLHPEQMLWAISIASVFTGWLLWRTSAAPSGSLGEALEGINIFGSIVLLFIGLVNMLQILFISLEMTYVGAILALCWVVVAGFLYLVFAD